MGSKPHNFKGKKTSSQQWLKRQLSDPYVKRASAENYRCRSAFKLLEMDDRYHLLQPGGVVIDCGAAPGSWTQVAVERTCSFASPENNSDQSKGLVIGVDLEHMLPVEGAFILHQSDFTLPETQQKISKLLNGKPVDVVLSDMAPPASGQKFMDHELIVELCFAVLRFGVTVLRPGGHLLCKLWQGGEQCKLESAMKQVFESVKVVKPGASRQDSAEVFLLGRNMRER